MKTLIEEIDITDTPIIIFKPDSGDEGPYMFHISPTCSELTSLRGRYVFIACDNDHRGNTLTKLQDKLIKRVGTVEIYKFKNRNELFKWLHQTYNQP